MNKITLLMVCCIAMTLNSAFSQLAQEKKYDFLKNYKAPDFKQRRFDIQFIANGGDQLIYNTSIDRRFSESTMLTYNQYSNQQDYQGSLSAGFRSNISWVKMDTLKQFQTNNGLSFYTQNRFYFKPKFFFGAYGDIFASHALFDVKDVTKNESVTLRFTPTVSIGYGRLEPIQYARNAMDIERQLTRGNRLNSPYSLEQLTQIADKLAVINNVRFYDFRLRRIEQFEALDQTLRSIGGINEFDISYFAHLADAYLYAQNFTRFSGFRNEIGISNASNLNYNVTLDQHNNGIHNALFYDLSYNLPQSYAVQHTIKVTAVVGASTYDITNSPVGIFTDEEAWLILGYELGLYPTTRTNFNFGARGGLDANSEGYKAEVYAVGSIYLSPQFRVSFNANFSPESSYFDHYFSSIPGLNTYNNTFRLGGGIQLNYAIF